MVFFIPGTDSKIFQGARRVFTFHIEIFSLLSELANSVMKRSKCEKWKLFKPLEKFKRKGLGWVICFLRLIEVYLYAIMNYFNLPRKVDCIMQNGTWYPRSQKTDLLLESILPEIIFFQWSQQSTLPIFPPIFLNLMCLYLNYEFSCVISKEKTYFLSILFWDSAQDTTMIQIITKIQIIWHQYSPITLFGPLKNIKSLAK